MTDETINLDTANRNELVEYAVDTLGLTLESKANKETIRNAINEKLGTGAPPVQEAEGEPVTADDIAPTNEASEEVDQEQDTQDDESDQDDQPKEALKAKEPKLKAPPKKGDKTVEKERVTIIVQASEKDKLPATVGVNGRNYVMQRGKEVSVPLSVVEVLKNAKQEIFDPETLASHEALTYPFQVVR